MENTLENKAKFFAQYWGQKVFKIQAEFCPATQQVNPQFIGKFLDEKSILELNPLSLITDEDVLIVSGLVGYRNVITDMRKKRELIKFTKEAINSHILVYKVVDYLRSKGYALPYMGLMIEKQIEYGWVILNKQ